MNGSLKRKGLNLSLARDAKVISGIKMKNKKNKEKSLKCYTVQCIACLRVLGISVKNFQDQKIFCMKCGKEEVMKLDFEKWEINVE